MGTITYITEKIIRGLYFGNKYKKVEDERGENGKEKGRNRDQDI
jgi:hypothetical protein